MTIPQSIRINPPQNIQLSLGNFYVEKILGEGGFGTVYLASLDNAYYALKLNRFWELHPQERTEIKRRIYQEFVISKTINSNYLVHSHGYEEVEGNPLIIYDYCDGGSLKDKIDKDFPPQFYKDIALQVLKGLNDLHQNNIIHRDLKPENILFKEDKVLLTDFGISVDLTRRLTQVNKRGFVEQIFASVCYSAPEQADKTVAYDFTGPTNDIFSFGVMMYEWFTHGKMPFGSITEFQTDPHKYEDRKKKGDWNMKLLKKKVPENIWYDIINRCLQPVPEDRYQQTEEVIQLLDPSFRTPFFNPPKQEIAPRSPDEQKMKATGWQMQIIEGLDAGKSFNLTNLSNVKNKRMLKVGRFDPDEPMWNDIILNEQGSSFISRFHATLEITKNQSGQDCWVIRDGQWCKKNGNSGWHKSRNGLYVNDIRVEGRIELSNKDVVQIGKIKLQIMHD